MNRNYISQQIIWHSAQFKDDQICALTLSVERLFFPVDRMSRAVKVFLENLGPRFKLFYCNGHSCNLGKIVMHDLRHRMCFYSFSSEDFCIVQMPQIMQQNFSLISYSKFYESFIILVPGQQPSQMSRGT